MDGSTMINEGVYIFATSLMDIQNSATLTSAIP